MIATPGREGFIYRAEHKRLRAASDRLIDFLAMNSYAFGCRDSQTHSVAADINDDYFDVIADLDSFPD